MLNCIYELQSEFSPCIVFDNEAEISMPSPCITKMSLHFSSAKSTHDDHGKLQYQWLSISDYVYFDS